MAHAPAAWLNPPRSRVLLLLALLAAVALSACDSGPTPPPEAELCTDADATNTGEPLPCQYDDDPGGEPSDVTLTLTSSPAAHFIIEDSAGVRKTDAQTELTLEYPREANASIYVTAFLAGRDTTGARISLDADHAERFELQWRDGLPPEGDSEPNPPQFYCVGQTDDQTGQIRSFPATVEYTLSQVHDLEGEPITAVQYISVGDELTAGETANFTFESQSEARVFARAKDAESKWSAFVQCHTPQWLDPYPAQPVAVASADGGLQTRTAGAELTFVDAGSFDRTAPSEDTDRTTIPPGSYDLDGSTWTHVTFTDTDTGRPHVQVDGWQNSSEFSVGDLTPGMHYIARQVYDRDYLGNQRWSESYVIGIPVQADESGEVTITDEITVGGEVFTDRITVDGGTARPTACLEQSDQWGIPAYPEGITFRVNACDGNGTHHWTTTNGRMVGQSVSVDFTNQFGPHQLTLWTTKNGRQSLPVVVSQTVVYPRSPGGAAGHDPTAYVSAVDPELRLGGAPFYFSSYSDEPYRFVGGFYVVEIPTTCVDRPCGGVRARLEIGGAGGPPVATFYSEPVYDFGEEITWTVPSDTGLRDYLSADYHFRVWLEYVSQEDAAPDSRIRFGDEGGEFLVDLSYY